MIVGLEGTGYKSPEPNSILINMTAGRKLKISKVVISDYESDFRY